MELFTKLSEIMGEGCTLTINIAKTENGMTVGVLPGNTLVKDAAKSKIVPLNINGTAEELDEGFVDAIISPIAKTNGMFADIKAFEEAQEAAKKASEMEKKANDEKKNKQDTFSKWMELADQNFKESKFKDAITCAKNALKFADNVPGGHSKADTLIKKATDSCTGGLFGEPDDKSDGKNIKINTKTSAPAKAKDESDDNDDNDNE